MKDGRAARPNPERSAVRQGRQKRIAARIVTMSNLLIAGSTGSLPAIAGEARWNFPDPATPLAADTLRVHNLFMTIITVIFFAVLSLILYSLYRHRHSRSHQPATFTGPRSRRQWLLTLLPFAGLLFIDYVVFGIPAFHAVYAYEDTKSNADLVVKVTASQWKWHFDYPAQKVSFTSTLTTPQSQIHDQEPKGENYLLEVDNPLVLPVGKKVRFVVTSTDVLHSLWIPAFGVKRDAVPGFLREFWATIETPGVYRGQCAELCGKDHGFMPAVVRAVPQAEFDQWVAAKLAEQQATAASATKTWDKQALIDQGKLVYEKNCVACHQANGQGLPGAFPALAGSRIVNAPIVDGEGRLRKDSHLDRVLNGRTGTAMPSFKGTLNDVEIAAVLTYERNSFGNTVADVVQPSTVAALR